MIDRDREIAWLEARGFVAQTSTQWVAEELTVFVGLDRCSAAYWPEAAKASTAEGALVRLAELAERNADVLRGNWCGEMEHGGQWALLATKIRERVGGDR